MEQYTFGPAGAQIPDASGATAQSGGARGLVPAPSSGDQNKFLKGDGTWAEVPSPDGKLDIAQGVGNAGKVMRVNSSGNLEPDNEQDISGKVNISQGVANTGKVMRVNSSGNLEPDNEQDISGKVNIAQGAANAGKILRIGSDGNLAADGTMTILSYGNSTWNDFITAYNSKSVVYCRASSNSNPASGSQTRLAFMAYVNNADNPTEVEFQYYRSVSSHTASQQGDQVFVYKLTSSGTWTVTTREASVKVVAGSNISGSYSNGTMTLSGNYSAFSSGNSGLVPAPASGDSGKFLKGDGTWSDDLQSQIDNLQHDIAFVENSNVASRNYSVGEFLVWNGVLHYVTANIASGETFVLGTNVQDQSNGGIANTIFTPRVTTITGGFTITAIGKMRLVDSPIGSASYSGGATGVLVETASAMVDVPARYYNGSANVWGRLRVGGDKLYLLNDVGTPVSGTYIMGQLIYFVV